MLRIKSTIYLTGRANHNDQSAFGGPNLFGSRAAQALAPRVGYLPGGILVDRYETIKSSLANITQSIMKSILFHWVKIWDFIGLWCLEFEISEYLNTREGILRDYLSIGYSTVKFHTRVRMLFSETWVIWYVFCLIKWWITGGSYDHC